MFGGMLINSDTPDDTDQGGAVGFIGDIIFILIPTF